MEENKAWQGKWIWSPDYGTASLAGNGAESQEIVYLRRIFQVPEGMDCRLSVDVSADSRYRLFLNGESVSIGPCKGDRSTHYYETVDLSDRLKPGKNVLAAKVVHFPYEVHRPDSSSSPASIWRSERGAFLLDGVLLDPNGSVLDQLHSDNRWKSLRDTSVTYQKETFTLFVGGAETVNGALVPQGWESLSYDDSAWASVVIVSATHDGMWGALMPWQLTARPIPPLYEKEKAFKRVMRSGIIQHNFTSAPLPVHSPEQLTNHVIASGETHWFELDAGELSTGYLRLNMTGGKGAKVEILSSECYEFPPEPGGKRNKGIRDEWKEGKGLYGPEDVYFAAGTGDVSAPECYEPFWFRGFRFVRLQITAMDEPVTLLCFSYRDTGYPLDVIGEFSCSNDSLLPLWKISLNTLARCMHETYEDTPYYEQMQYTMDTRLQILFTYCVSGDDRLARKAIYDFHCSLLPTGLLQARYPSVVPQVISGFSFFWIFMVYDHYKYFADAELIARYRPTMDAILEWFGRRVGADGLVGLLPEAYWHMIDWVEEWKELYGAPPASRVGPLTVINLMYADALTKAAELNQYTGRVCVAAEYRNRAENIVSAVRAECFSEKRGLFRDGPKVEQFSQHTQIWAVLTGVVQENDAVSLMRRMLDEPELPSVSIAYAYFLFRALSMTGLYNHTLPLWDIWHNQVELHLTSWVEDPVLQRSDCHGWGAAPLYEFPAEILGVTPAEPGFSSIGIAPQPGFLQWASGTVPTKAGIVNVSWRIDEERTFRLNVDAPSGVPVIVNMPDGSTVSLLEAKNAELTCPYI